MSKSWHTIFIAVCAVLALKTNIVLCDYYSSIADLEFLLDVEGHLLEHFENYLQRVENTNKQIAEFLDDVDDAIDEAAENPEVYYGDPINAFKTVNRMVTHWKNSVYDKIFATTEFDDYKQNITALETVNVSEDDLVGAVKALVRLQKMYDLPTIDLADGVLLDEHLTNTLSASDCYVIGNTLYHLEQHRYAVEWLMAARALLSQDIAANDTEIAFPPANEPDILGTLSSSLFQTGNTKLALKLNNELLKIVPDNEHGLKNRALFESRLFQEIEISPKSINNSVAPKSKKSETDKLYQRVCREELRQTPSEQRPLRCRYTSNNVPYRLIGPFKLEELNLDPFVAYYHEAIFDGEMAQIINETKDKVERSKVGQKDGITVSDIRTSKNTWLWYHQHSFLITIRTRLEDITGLSTKTAEALQVANYGIGGHYEPHFDFVKNSEKVFGVNGNRILTALFYINDVQLGGATAFPFLRLAVRPVRGSLLVWYNMHTTLENDFRTLHAGCPVLMGSKWILNQWFHEFGQELKRPCGLQLEGTKSVAYAVEE